MGDQTLKRIQTLARNHCAAFTGKDGCCFEPNGQPRCQWFRTDPQALPFIESGDMRCLEFERGVLPSDPALEANYFNRKENAAKCERCSTPIVKTSNRMKYCAECREIRRKQGAADRARKRYWEAKT
ncbi:hypothetical protein [Paenibacillus sp. VMFN-D1]|uniref:hypothetical protein n=1 Tax=Paenibacillus sp. VMFN-D1 TaxID=2135608 RepID=UPI000E25ABE9|nr:hypothetical protein [Paenibacillus sp. VMFN-D1]RED32418.1 hypothetical protein C7820_5698 [Paenibacillus sp. VMFN-D1]